MTSLLVLTIIITSAAMLAALFQTVRLGNAEFALFDEEAAHERTLGKLAVAKKERNASSLQLHDVAHSLEDERAANQELLQLNHEMATSLLQAEAERLSAQNELTRLHQRLYRQSERKSPLSMPISNN